METHPHILPARTLISLSSVLFAAAFILSLVALIVFFRHRNHHHNTSNSDDKASLSYSLRLFPTNIPPSDASRKAPARQPPGYVSTNRSSEFLYLGALVNYTVDPEQDILSSNGGSKLGDPSCPYQKLGSPKLNPLPPMPELQTLQSVEQFLQYEQMGSFENDVKEKNTYQRRNIEKNSWKNQEIHVNNPSKFK
ncbi:hypothetical protein ES319_D01G112500v1 [Gossypium barbadense]|uniref:Uncharacterized protein n=1 Tax=Gossypium barbadense TaxID=3634 RepID=A0A5J5SMJ6_GOSBA|nr:hypothetical protein ES319_D01G112500v1 [Gossypium barbadense]